MPSLLDLQKDIRSLTDFKRKTPGFVRQMKRTGRPIVLTVNGQAKLVVQDAVAFQEIMDRVEAVEGIRRGLEQMRRGQGRPAGKFFRAMRRKYGIPR